MSTAPHEAGPGLPRAAPSVRIRNPGSVEDPRTAGFGATIGSTSPNDRGSSVTPDRRSLGIASRRLRREHRQLDPRLRRRIAAAEPPPGPLERILELVRDALLERDDRVVGDLDVLRADLGAALRDVAVPDPAGVLQVLAPVGVVHRVHLEAGRPDEIARAHERPLGLVVAQDVADVLAQEALDAFPILLDPLDVLLLPAPILLGLVGGPP